MGNGASLEDGGTGSQSQQASPRQQAQSHRSAPHRRAQGFQEVEIRPATYSNDRTSADGIDHGDQWQGTGVGSNGYHGYGNPYGPYGQRSQHSYNSDNGKHANDRQNVASYGQDSNYGQSPSYEAQGYSQGTGSVQKTNNYGRPGEPEQPQYSEGDIVFETFVRNDDMTFTCLFQNGERYYMEWTNGDWKPFPRAWYKQGVLITDSKVEDDTAGQGTSYPTPEYDSSMPDPNYQNNELSSENDDRSGTIQHPARGLLSTYLFEEKRNVHCFFDDSTGEWLKLPLDWELHSEFVDNIVQKIDDALPGWNDKHDILAALRVSNYDAHDCIDNYLTIGDQTSMTSPRSAEDAKALKMKENKIKDLEKKCNKLAKVYEHTASQLHIANQDKLRYQEEIHDLQGRISELEVSARQAKVQVHAIQQQLVRHKPELGNMQGIDLHQVVLNVMQKQEEKLKHTESQLKEEKRTREEAEDEAMGLKMKVDMLDREHKYTRDQLVHLEADQEVVRKEQAIRRQLEREKSNLQHQLEDQIKSPKIGKVGTEKLRGIKTTTLELHKSCIKLKLTVESNFNGLIESCRQAINASRKLEVLNDGATNEEVEKLRALYRKEALQRKILFNQLQDLRGNIRVFARCRKDTRVRCCMEFPTDEEVMVQAPAGLKKYEFNRVFGPEATQEQVFEDTLPIVTSCVDGYNVCILAYGQTGSGKTHTMMGPPDDPGVNIRAIQELLHITNERVQVSYCLKVSMVEIYNENVIDLLTTDAKILNVQSNGQQVKIVNLKETVVESLSDINVAMETGMENRHTAATKMNSQSSRSHLLVILVVEGVDKASGMRSRGTLTLCDLAGSERVGKTEATGQRLVEAAAINKSLTSLGLVFSALRAGQLHIPYRNSKLTHILQPSLGGDAKACLFVMLSPAESNLSETISTLTFGSNVRQVQLGQAKANVERKLKKK